MSGFIRGNGLGGEVCLWLGMKMRARGGGRLWLNRGEVSFAKEYDHFVYIVN